MRHDGRTAREWAYEESGHADFGDRRRTARLVRMAAALAEQPGGKVLTVFRSNAEQQGVYDLLGNDMPGPAKRPPRPPSQTWGTFIRTHAVGTIAVDYFTVPTATFGMLYVFFVLSLERRRVIHVNVTEHPTAEWAAQQVVEAVGPGEGVARLIRDRDKIFGAAFDLRVENLGLTQLRTAPRCPWQNGFAERWVGTARREIVDHWIVLGEHHLRRILREYVAYYNADRPHMSLRGDAPMRRDVQPPSMGRVVAMPRLGGLHYRYARVAA